MHLIKSVLAAITVAILVALNPAAASAATVVVATVTTGSSPFDSDVSPDGTKVYVTNYNAATVSVIDAETNSVIRTYTDSNIIAPRGITVDNSGRYVYVANDQAFGDAGEGGLAVIDTVSNTVSAIHFGDIDVPYELVLSPDGSKLYASRYAARDIKVISTASKSVTATISLTASVGNSIYDLDISSDGSELWISGTSEAFVVSTATNSQTHRIALPETTFGLAVSGDKVVFVYPNIDTITIVDRATHSISRTISPAAAAGAWGVTATPDGSLIYVINSGLNRVVEFDASTMSQTASINVGASPWYASVSPNSATLYVANTGADTITVLSTGLNTDPAPELANTGQEFPGNLFLSSIVLLSLGLVAFSLRRVKFSSK